MTLRVSKIAGRVGERFAKDLNDARRAFINEQVFEARRVFYTLKSRVSDILELVESDAAAREVAHRMAGDHILALPGELTQIEDCLAAVAYGLTEMESLRLKEVLPHQVLQQFEDLTDQRMAPTNEQ
jgi:hypothetical protein